MVGSWSFADDGAATFVAPEPNKRPFGLCVSNTRFSDGEIRLRISSDQPSEVDGRVLLGYHSPSNDYFVVGLGGYGKAYTLTHYNNLRGWTEIAGTGLSANLTPKKPYELCVRVSGKKITLEENDVEVISFELEQPIPYGQIGLFAWGAGGTKFENVRVKRDASSIEHVVILIHGIRTQADWQTMLHDEFSKAGIAVAPTNYGRFELFKFLFPIRSFTQPAIDRVWDLIRSVKRDYPNAKISFLAHSFGTHILTKILERDIDLKIHRIAFCGSVVRYDFPLQRYTQQFLPPIVNEVSANDPWPAIAEKLGFGYGSVGTRGFKSHYVEDRWHDGFGHSQYLTNIFCKTFWIPFFRDGNVVKSGNNPQPQKCWLRLLLLLTSKWTIATALILIALAWHFLWFFPEPIYANQIACVKFRSSNAKAWREQHLLTGDPEDTFYVIVRSVEKFKQFAPINRVVTRLQTMELRQRFPEIDFDAMDTSNPQGGNRMGAIVVARALPDKQVACRIAALSYQCGVSEKPYVYRLGKRPEGC